jgi:hypothetical protein
MCPSPADEAVGHRTFGEPVGHGDSHAEVSVEDGQRLPSPGSLEHINTSVFLAIKD